MDKQKVNTAIDSAAEQAKQTMDLLSGKIDDATQCARETGANIRESAKKRVVEATEKVEQAVTAAAERVKRKMQE